jgi:hypothetical protein
MCGDIGSLTHDKTPAGTGACRKLETNSLTVDTSKPHVGALVATPPSHDVALVSSVSRDRSTPLGKKTLGEAGFKFEWLRVVAQCRLGSATKSVASWLANHANSAGFNGRPGMRVLAFETELSERTVRRCLEQLRDLGLLVRTVKGSTAAKRKWADEYVLAIPDDLHTRVQVEDGPRERQSGEGKGGMANHVRWHERKDKMDPSCVHCAEAHGGVSEGSEGMREPFTEPSAVPPSPIRPVANRTPTTGQTDADHWSLETYQQGSTNKDVFQNAASSDTGPRASSRARDLPSFAGFFETQWKERVAPGEELTEEDVTELEYDIGYDYVISCIGGDDFYPGEEALIFGRLSNGDSPKAIVNNILKVRDEAA